jgi:hypothetical protein
MDDATREMVDRWVDETFPGADPESVRGLLRAVGELTEVCLTAATSPPEVAAPVRGVLREALVALFGVAYGADLRGAATLIRESETVESWYRDAVRAAGG